MGYASDLHGPWDATTAGGVRSPRVRREASDAATCLDFILKQFETYVADACSMLKWNAKFEGRPNKCVGVGLFSDSVHLSPVIYCLLVLLSRPHSVFPAAEIPAGISYCP